MTSATITLACIVALPIAIIVGLRVNATLVFLSLGLGDLLAQFVASDANSLTSLFSTSHVTSTIHPNNNTWSLILILLPIVITIGIMIHTIKGNSRMVLNLLPALGVGFVGALLIVPLLPSSASNDIIHSPLWSQMTRAQGLIVGISALACLSSLWLQRPKHGGGKHSKHGS
jgi:hypothetical protein